MRRRITGAFLPLALLPLALLGPLAAGARGSVADPTREEFLSGPVAGQIDRFLTGCERYGFGGVAIVYAAGAIQLHKAYGLADRRTGEPMRVQTRLPMKRIEPLLLRSALAQLGRAGKIDPRSERVERLVASLEEGAQSGIRSTLTTLIESTSGASFGIWMGEHVLRPAGMRDALFIEEPAPDREIARLYRGRSPALRLLGGVPVLRPPIRLFGGSIARASRSAVDATPADGIAATAFDMLKLDLALDHDPALRAQATRRAKGIFAGPFPGSAEIVRIRDGETRVLVLVNDDMGWSGPIRAGVGGILGRGGSPFLYGAIALGVALLAFLILSAVQQANVRPGRRRRARIPLVIDD